LRLVESTGYHEVSLMELESSVCSPAARWPAGSAALRQWALEIVAVLRWTGSVLAVAELPNCLIDLLRSA
jgi:hypothetical protein